MLNGWFFPAGQRLVIDANDQVIGALCAKTTAHKDSAAGVPAGGCVVGDLVPHHKYRLGWTRYLPRHLEHEAHEAQKHAKAAKKTGRAARIVHAFTGGPRR